MSDPNPPHDLRPSNSTDSVNSHTPLQQQTTDTNNNTEKKIQYIHAPPDYQPPSQSENNATIITNQDQDQVDILNIAIEMEVKEEEDNCKKVLPLQSPSINLHTHSAEDNSLTDKTRESRTSIDSITQRTDFSNKQKSPNPLDTTKLRHDGNDVEIGAIQSDSQNSPVIPPYHKVVKRMPSISYNNVDKELASLRKASRRRWWSPIRLCDWCMHKLIFGKILVMILTWTTVIDYGKDLYVAYHFAQLLKWWEFAVTLCILFLSLRLMLYLRAIDDSSISFWKLLIFYLPGSVYADFQIDRFSDVGVCVFWEIAILIGTPFVPFFLIYLAMRKSISLFCYTTSNKTHKRSFENPYLLSYAVVECIFETIPQLCLQTYLYFYHKQQHGKQEVSFTVFITAWIVSVLVLIKIPIVVWYNWRIVYKLSFKRRHAGEIISMKYHPIQDLIATGSWDHTVLINSIISKGLSNEIKAKRVLDHHYNINCVAFHSTSFDILAVAGQGVELFNWRIGKSIASFPKTKERDQLRRKKRHRTKEVKEVVFSPDGSRLIWCQGKNVLVWNIAPALSAVAVNNLNGSLKGKNKNKNKLKAKELLKIKCIQGDRLGDVQTIDISPNGKYIACGLYQPFQIKVYNSYNKDLIRVLEGHTSAVTCVKFDRQGKYVISGGADCRVLVFDLRSGELIKYFNKHSCDVMCIAIDYTNRYIASAGRDKTLYITYLDDKKENKELRELENWVPYKTARDIRCCDFSPYGDSVACACEDHQVYILTLPKECHIKTYRFSMDFGTQNSNSQQKQININNNTEANANNEKQYSDIANKFDPNIYTTNDYNKFDPKEHNLF